MAIDSGLILLLIGDPEGEDITEEQIVTLSELYGDNALTVAVAAARTLMNMFAKQVTKKSGDVSINASDKFDHYKTVVAELQREVRRMSLGATSAYAGGISISDKDTRADDTDRVAPLFTRDLHDNPAISDGLTNE